MKKICTLLSLYLLCLSIGLSAQSKAEAYQEILDKAQQKGIPALAVFVRDANGNAWQGKAGFTTIESGTLLDVNQSFRIASITKLFTTLVILQLLDEKKLDLNDPITKYLNRETQNKIPHAAKISILQLLSHSSGIYSFTENNSFWKECYFEEGMSRTWQPDEILTYIARKSPQSKPLEPYSKKLYSNSNYILLGMIIEKITANSLANEYQKRIFTKLKMNDTFLEGYDLQTRRPIDTYIVPQTSFAKTALKRKLIQKVSGSEYANLSSTYTLFNSWAWAAGGISSNVQDLSVFLSALKNKQLISEKSHKVLVKLNSSEDKGIQFFGGTGGSDGIQATMLHLMPSNVDIIILMNATGDNQVTLSTIFVDLYKVASTKK